MWSWTKDTPITCSGASKGYITLPGSWKMQHQLNRKLHVPKDQASCIHEDQIIEVHITIAEKFHRLQQRRIAFWDAEKENRWFS